MDVEEFHLCKATATSRVSERWRAAGGLGGAEDVASVVVRCDSPGDGPLMLSSFFLLLF